MFHGVYIKSRSSELVYHWFELVYHGFELLHFWKGKVGSFTLQWLFFFSVIYAIFEPEGRETKNKVHLWIHHRAWAVRSSQKHQRTALFTFKANLRTVKLVVTFLVCLLESEMEMFLSLRTHCVWLCGHWQHCDLLSSKRGKWTKSESP